MCDYQEKRDYKKSGTTGQTDAGQSNPYVPLCFAGDKMYRQHHAMKTEYAKGMASLMDTVACEFQYCIVIVYGRFTLTIVMVKRPYTIRIKYLTSQAKLACKSKKLHPLSTLF